MAVQRVITLRLAFTAADPDHATRKLRSLLKWLLRTWGVRCLESRDESQREKLDARAPAA